MPDSSLQLSRIQAGLVTTRLGANLHHLLETDSTNKVARQLAENGAADGEIVIAEQQSAGRGRLGRSWVSPPFVNLYISFILRPRLAPVDAPQVTLAAAVALADAVAAFIPMQPTIKWPNDILVGGKKLAGILTESSCSAERLEFVILGIGVNLNFPVRAMPEEIRQRASSLLELRGQPVDRESFICRLIHDLDRCYGILQESGFAAVAARWQSYFALHRRLVRVEMIDQTIVGHAQGIDRDGALIIERENGARERILAGDVIPVED
ncbi:MAG: biotin--[acetyl-CoA-carboxylase] ligase [Deltaproteobacteria bacterium]|nr:biotin--[acetyl-CoA-carboxylase] ligase [Deltaproteobacteria bacterium]